MRASGVSCRSTQRARDEIRLNLILIFISRDCEGGGRTNMKPAPPVTKMFLGVYPSNALSMSCFVCMCSC
jgi:hypothetical protein